MNTRKTRVTQVSRGSTTGRNVDRPGYQVIPVAFIEKDGRRKKLGYPVNSTNFTEFLEKHQDIGVPKFLLKSTSQWTGNHLLASNALIRVITSFWSAPDEDYGEVITDNRLLQIHNKPKAESVLKSLPQLSQLLLAMKKEELGQAPHKIQALLQDQELGTASPFYEAISKVMQTTKPIAIQDENYKFRIRAVCDRALRPRNTRVNYTEDTISGASIPDSAHSAYIPNDSISVRGKSGPDAAQMYNELSDELDELVLERARAMHDESSTQMAGELFMSMILSGLQRGINDWNQERFFLQSSIDSSKYAVTSNKGSFLSWTDGRVDVKEKTDRGVEPPQFLMTHEEHLGKGDTPQAEVLMDFEFKRVANINGLPQHIGELIGQFFRRWRRLQSKFSDWTSLGQIERTVFLLCLNQTKLRISFALLNPQWLKEFFGPFNRPMNKNDNDGQGRDECYEYTKKVTGSHQDFFFTKAYALEMPEERREAALMISSFIRGKFSDFLSHANQEKAQKVGATTRGQSKAK